MIAEAKIVAIAAGASSAVGVTVWTQLAQLESVDAGGVLPWVGGTGALAVALWLIRGLIGLLSSTFKDLADDNRVDRRTLTEELRESRRREQIAINHMVRHGIEIPDELLDDDT